MLVTFTELSAKIPNQMMLGCYNKQGKTKCMFGCVNVRGKENKVRQVHRYIGPIFYCENLSA